MILLTLGVLLLVAHLKMSGFVQFCGLNGINSMFLNCLSILFYALICYSDKLAFWKIITFNKLRPSRNIIQTQPNEAIFNDLYFNF
jgi:hypothetical protein